MGIRIIEIVMKEGLGTIRFRATSWKICDGCVIFHDIKKQEMGVFPLTSIVCFL